MVILIYGALFIATSAYAFCLERVKRAYEPDMTWLEVVIGVALVLSAPLILARVEPGDWRLYEARVWVAFVVGGLPIIIWQFQRLRRNMSHIQGEAKRLLSKAQMNDGYTATTMAEPRGTKPSADEGNR